MRFWTISLRLVRQTAGASAVTSMPRPAREITTPCRSSSWYAFATVLKLMTFGSAHLAHPRQHLARPQQAGGDAENDLRHDLFVFRDQRVLTDVEQHDSALSSVCNTHLVQYSAGRRNASLFSVGRSPREVAGPDARA